MYRKVPLGLVALLAALLVPQSPVLAQSEGRVVGQVLDTRSGQPLVGAQVLVTGTSVGVVAGLDGRYQIARVPAGEVSLTVQMLGYATKTVTGIEVPEGGVRRIDVTLDAQALELAGITVTAEQERGSAVRAITQQRTATGVVSAISSEQISRSPDGDAAAAIRRVSGVTVQDGKYIFVRGLGERYTTSSLNGSRIPSPEPERKVVPLDLFPAGLIQTITTSKTFTPDQPGDFSGASVDIRTPEFPGRRQISVSLSSGYQPDILGRSILAAPTDGGEWLARATSTREAPAPALNYSGQAARGPEVNNIVNSFRNAWSVQEGRGNAPLSASGTIGGSENVLGQTFGYLGSLTYSSSPEVRLEERRARYLAGGAESDRFDGESGSSSVLWGGLLNLSATLGPSSRISLNNNYNRSADNEARDETGIDENTRSTVRIQRLRYTERVVRSNQLAGEHQMGSAHRLDWSGTTSAVSRSEPDRSEWVTWEDPATPTWFNEFESAVRTFGGLEESNREAALNYQFTFGSLPGKPHRIKVGGLRRTTERDASVNAWRITTFDWGTDDPRWQLPPEQIFDGRFSGADDTSFILSPETSGGTYDADDELLAAYLMGEVQLGERFRLIGGARLEDYTLAVRSENQQGQAALTEREYSDILPAAALNIELTENQQLRLSASRTLARPEYRELAPITYRTVLGGDQVIGNRELERTLIENYDLRWEWYPAPGEVLSLALFGKRFDKPIEQRYLGRSGTETLTFENALSATNYGVELELSKGLGFLAPSLENLALFTNATVMQSRVQVEGEDEDRAMVGQAPYVLNSGVTWSSRTAGWSSTLLYNVVGERIVNARPSGRDVPDVFEQPRPLLDLSLRFPLMGGASGKLDLKNLLDAPYELRQGEIVREQYRSGRSASFGLSLRM